MKDPIENMVFKILDDFKDGIADGLISGTRSETNRTYHYKQGYDYGLTLYDDLNDYLEDNNIRVSRDETLT